MNVDRYTKSILTVIAVSVSGVAISQFSQPRASATPPSEAGKFDNITYQYGGNSISFFDKSTGDLWYYGGFGSEEKPQHLKLNQLGAPLERMDK